MEATSLKRSSPLPSSRRLLAALSDERLAGEAKRGNRAAFEVIYDRHHRGLLAFCRHMLGSREDAEDALQHTFASAFRALPSNQEPARLKPWLYTIARNRCVSVLRARHDQPSGAAERASTAGLSEEVERRAELRELLTDIEELPEKQRAALILSEVADLRHPEIAHVLECEVKQVKAFIFQARSSLSADRHARSIPCGDIREELATAAGGALRRATLRRHVKSCPGCAQFRDDVRRQRALLAVLLPVTPSLGLKRTALAAAGIGGGGAAGGGAAGGGLVAALGAHGAVKVAAIAVATGGALGGVAATNPHLVSGARLAVERVANEVRAIGSGDAGRGGSSAAPGESGTGRSKSVDWESAQRAARKKGSQNAGRDSAGERATSETPRDGSRSGDGGRSARTAPTEKNGQAGSSPGTDSGERAKAAARRTGGGSAKAQPESGGHGRGGGGGGGRPGLPSLGRGGGGPGGLGGNLPGKAKVPDVSTPSSGLR